MRKTLAAAALAAACAALLPAAPATACAGECDPCDNVWQLGEDATLGLLPDRDWNCIDSLTR